jgi:hypothetical protein
MCSNLDTRVPHPLRPAKPLFLRFSYGRKGWEYPVTFELSDHGDSSGSKQNCPKLFASGSFRFNVTVLLLAAADQAGNQ